MRKGEEEDEIVKKGQVPFHAVKVYGGSRDIAPLILTLALDGEEWLASRPGRFISGE
jgi:hypothetical protein